MPTILDQIVAAKREEVARAKARDAGGGVAAVA